jgi:hypothetical protein
MSILPRRLGSPVSSFGLVRQGRQGAVADEMIECCLAACAHGRIWHSTAGTLAAFFRITGEGQPT